MDVLLTGISLEWFGILTWVTAVLIGVLCFFAMDHERYWEVVFASVVSLLAASLAFLLANLAVATYILSSATTSRWSTGKDPLMTTNDVEFSVPFTEGLVDALNNIQHSVSGAVNTVGYIKNSIGAADDFLLMVWYSIGVVIFLAVCAFITRWWAKRVSKREEKRTLAALQSEITQLRADVDEIQRQRGLSTS